MFGASYSFTLDVDEDMRPLSFCRKLHSVQLLFEAFFDITGIFCSIQP